MAAYTVDKQQAFEMLHTSITLDTAISKANSIKEEERDLEIIATLKSGWFTAFSHLEEAISAQSLNTAEFSPYSFNEAELDKLEPEDGHGYNFVWDCMLEAMLTLENLVDELNEAKPNGSCELRHQLNTAYLVLMGVKHQWEIHIGY